MRSEDLRREENHKEFLRLKQDADYPNVMYDEKSVGISDVHRGHKFSKKDRGLWWAAKSCDGFLNDLPREIKTIEGQGYGLSAQNYNMQKSSTRSVLSPISLMWW